MKQDIQTGLQEKIWDNLGAADTVRLRTVASASLVNRTHRIVRERAVTIEAQKTKVRSLLIPLTVSAALLLAVVCAAWIMLDEYDVTPVGLPDASNQIFVMMLWCLPISAIALAVVAFRRNGSRVDTGGRR